MPKYRKKPVVIEAIQVKEENFEGPHPDHVVGHIYDPKQKVVLIDTLEGRMVANLGDWIIKGVKGEYYPCKPDIFEATYEKVDD